MISCMRIIERIMMNFGEPKQPYYTAGRDIEVIKKDMIEGICQCGYLTLNPVGEFEKHNGGITVKRSKVKIIREDGSIVKTLRGKFNRYSGCNACINDWK